MNDSRLYDKIIFQLICDYIKQQQPKVVIISPNGDFVADMIANGIEEKIEWYNVCWDKFCYALK